MTCYRRKHIYLRYSDIERSDILSNLSVRIKDLRENLKDKDSKWTQKYVADKIGVARVTYTAYENDTKMPPPDIISNIADLFGVTTDYLLGRSDQPHLNEEEAFEAFKNDPSLERWYKELPKSKEEDLQRLRKIWEAYKEDI